MEFDFKIRRPLVRVGSLQSEKKISFTSHETFDVFDLCGEKIMVGEPEKTYDVTIEDSNPALTNPMIRLAISYDHSDAQQLTKKWEEKKLNIHLIRVGENTQVGSDQYIDNRRTRLPRCPSAPRSRIESRR